VVELLLASGLLLPEDEDFKNLLLLFDEFDVAEVVVVNLSSDSHNPPFAVTAGSAAAATTTMATTTEHSTAIAATAVPSTVAVQEAASIPRRSERLSGVVATSIPPPALVSHTVVATLKTAKKRNFVFVFKLIH
jgi:hypothetical protein